MKPLQRFGREWLDSVQRDLQARGSCNPLMNFYQFDHDGNTMHNVIHKMILYFS